MVSAARSNTYPRGKEDLDLVAEVVVSPEVEKVGECLALRAAGEETALGCAVLFVQVLCNLPRVGDPIVAVLDGRDRDLRVARLALEAAPDFFIRAADELVRDPERAVVSQRIRFSLTQGRPLSSTRTGRR